MSTGTQGQRSVDERNASFWDELCGSSLARAIGVTDASPESLARFDAAYLDHYPYLPPYYEREALSRRQVLEIGLGFGTVSEQLARRGPQYHGVDIARGPVQMVRERLANVTGDSPDSIGQRVRQGSALELPFEAERFDFVYSIGCLHHTGDLPRAIAEAERVLRPGGRAVVMLYNRFSYRRLRKVYLPRLLRRRAPSSSGVRGLYDTNEAGEVAPHTDYVSRGEARRLFRHFDQVSITARNFDAIPFLGRQRFLGNLDHVLGLDLYITATK